MQISAIKKLVESNPSIADLDQAENLLLEGESLQIEVQGADEGEQLTHIIAAKEIIANMTSNAVDFKTALRAYTKKVRGTID